MSKIDIKSLEDFITITELENIETVTITHLDSGEFEIEFDAGDDIKTYTLSRGQMKEIKKWIDEALK